MKRNLRIVLLFSISPAIGAQPVPEAVDPGLTIISTQIDTRVLVYQRCSPEHCWSESYLQVLSSDSDDPKVLCTAKIQEIFVGQSVQNISWSMIRGAPRIRIKVAASHGGFKPHAVTVVPLDGCQYGFIKDRSGG